MFNDLFKQWNWPNRNTSLPSKTEARILESLVHLYDAYVYNPFLRHQLGRNLSSRTSELLNNIYHHLMDWLAQYQRWCRDMSDLRKRYMKPLLDCMATSPIAQEDLRDLQERLSQARSVLTKPIRMSDEITDKTIVKVLNLSARRVGNEHGIALKRTKTRYKREHTIWLVETDLRILVPEWWSNRVENTASRGEKLEYGVYNFM